MNEKANVFTHLAEASGNKGIKGTVCESRTLSFLWKVNVSSFIGTLMSFTGNLPRFCGASGGARGKL